jgi:hypothetical protein
MSIRLESGLVRRLIIIRLESGLVRPREAGAQVPFLNGSIKLI